MDECLLKEVTVRKLDEELRVGASWDDCTLIARPHAKACSLQVKFGKRRSLFMGGVHTHTFAWLCYRVHGYTIISDCR